MPYTTQDSRSHVFKAADCRKSGRECQCPSVVTESSAFCGSCHKRLPLLLGIWFQQRPHERTTLYNLEGMRDLNSNKVLTHKRQNMKKRTDIYFFFFSYPLRKETTGSFSKCLLQVLLHYRASDAIFHKNVLGSVIRHLACFLDILPFDFFLHSSLRLLNTVFWAGLAKTFSSRTELYFSISISGI